jgi:uncharacterized protein
MTPDVNVLVAASRSDHPHHATALRWLHDALAQASAGRSLLLMPMVVASFLRLVTHPRVFPVATPPAKAVAFVDALLAAPGVHMATVGPEWPRLRDLCIAKGLGANAVPDAWLAAAVQEHGDHLVTFDTDFKKLLDRSSVTVLSPA